MSWASSTAPIHGYAPSFRDDTPSISGSLGSVAHSCTLVCPYAADASFGQLSAGIASYHVTCGRASNRTSSTPPCSPYRARDNLAVAWPTDALLPARCPPPHLAPRLAASATLASTSPARATSYSRPTLAVHVVAPAAALAVALVAAIAAVAVADPAADLDAAIIVVLCASSA